MLDLAIPGVWLSTLGRYSVQHTLHEMIDFTPAQIGVCKKVLGGCTQLANLQPTSEIAPSTCSVVPSNNESMPLQLQCAMQRSVRLAHPRGASFAVAAALVPGVLLSYHQAAAMMAAPRWKCGVCGTKVGDFLCGKCVSSEAGRRRAEREERLSALRADRDAAAATIQVVTALMPF